MKEAQHEAGFTLIELLIVIAIISILIAIALPSYQNYTRRAHYTEIVEAAEPFKLSVEQCFQFTGRLSDCTAGRYGVPENQGPSGRLVASVRLGPRGKIHLMPQARFGIKTSDDYTLKPKNKNGILIWQASGGGVRSGYAQGHMDDHDDGD